MKKSYNIKSPQQNRLNEQKKQTNRKDKKNEGRVNKKDR